MVEAPGYCPPGPKCLFHLTIYRRSRLPGMPKIGNPGLNLKESTVWMMSPNGRKALESGRAMLLCVTGENDS